MTMVAFITAVVFWVAAAVVAGVEGHPGWTVFMLIAGAVIALEVAAEE